MASLYEWFLHYLKQKDLHFGHIKEIKHLKKDFFFVLKVKKGEESHEFGYVSQTTTGDVDVDSIIKYFHEEKPNHPKLQFSYIALLNSDKNFKFLNENWDKLLEFKFLKVYFVNPSTEMKVWAVSPFSHNFVGGSKKALKVFFDDLGEIKDSDLKKLEKETL